MDEFSVLTRERVTRYRQAAADARERARKAETGELRESHLLVAQEWIQLANELEYEILTGRARASA